MEETGEKIIYETKDRWAPESGDSPATERHTPLRLDESLSKFKDPFDRMEYLLALTHFSYDEAAEAYYRMAKLFPELLRTRRIEQSALWGISVDLINVREFVLRVERSFHTPGYEPKRKSYGEICGCPSCQAPPALSLLNSVMKKLEGCTMNSS